MYKAQDLDFFVKRVEDMGTVAVVGNIIGHWDDDNIGGHNVDQTALKKAGLELTETTECLFVFENPDTSIKDGIDAMIQAGFVYNAEFEKEVFYDVD